jgi:hypothetical protein
MSKPITIVAIAGMYAAVAAVSAQTDHLDQDWKAFRRQRPFHVQTIALSPADSRGARTLVISEPPPHVTTRSLSESEPALGPARIGTQPIGMDGWVKDIVYRLPRLSDRELTGLVDRLSVQLFGTAYKAYASEIAPIDTPRVQLDYRVSAAQLRDWLFVRQEMFHPLGRTAGQPIARLLAAGRTGVFYSGRPGLVAWLVPRRGDLGAFGVEARQFALDTDLIVGAIAGTNHVAIIGRERQVTVDVLPPLRAETMMLLASVNDGELAQSYERNNFQAGKLKDNTDWAPIYLSDVLIDTEYGSLLNITDQLLKSWTSAGQVTYRYFSYDPPERWPFKAPLFELLDTPALTFNWNTRGVGYDLAADHHSLFALARTGALPVSYLPDGLSPTSAAQVSGFEDTGYDFFSSTGDPNLARVVQYAALFQIFQHYDVTAQRPARSSRPHPEMNRLVAMTRDDLATFMTLGDGLDRLPPSSAAKLRNVQHSLDAYRRASGDATFGRLAAALADPRATTTGNRENRMSPEIRDVTAALRPVRLAIVDPDDALDAYRDDAARTPDSWIKTPSYVVSTSWRPTELTGGHNLDMRITRFETAADVPRGAVRLRGNLLGERVVTINPVDVPKLGAVVRTAAREDPVVLKARLEGVLKNAAPLPATRSEALGLRPTLGRDLSAADRGLTREHLPSASYRSGWSPAAVAINPDYRPAVGASARRAIYVDRNPDLSYHIVAPGADMPFAARTYDAAVDFVALTLRQERGVDGAMTVYFGDVKREEISNFLTSVQVRSKATERPIGFGRDKTTRLAEFRTKLDGTYRFDSARIVDSRIETVAEGQRLHVEVEIPAVNAVRPPLRVRIAAMFRQITESVQQSILELVTKLRNGGIKPAAGAARPLSTREILSAINADLKAMYPDAGVEVILAGAGDFFVAEIHDGRPLSAS